MAFNLNGHILDLAPAIPMLLVYKTLQVQIKQVEV